MEEAVAVRRAAEDAVGDVVPADLRAVIVDFVADGSVVPGVLTVLCARALADGDVEVAERAAGVQLIYDGLRLTRDLAHEDPWVNGDRDRADMHILAADVLVSRGFYLLARTEAAAAAVEVVRAFGRDQTLRAESADPAGVDRNLESDVLDLALVAGTTAVGRDTTDGLRAFAADLAAAVNGTFPQPESAFDDDARERLARLADGDGTPAMNRND